MFCTTIQISLKLLWKFDNTHRLKNNAMSAVCERGTNRLARMVSGNMEINEILRCICLNGGMDGKCVWKCERNLRETVLGECLFKEIV